MRLFPELTLFVITIIIGAGGTLATITSATSSPPAALAELPSHPLESVTHVLAETETATPYTLSEFAFDAADPAGDHSLNAQALNQKIARMIAVAFQLRPQSPVITQGSGTYSQADLDRVLDISRRNNENTRTDISRSIANVTDGGTFKNTIITDSLSVNGSVYIEGDHNDRALDVLGNFRIGNTKTTYSDHWINNDTYPQLSSVNQTLTGSNVGEWGAIALGIDTIIDVSQEMSGKDVMGMRSSAIVPEHEGYITPTAGWVYGGYFDAIIADGEKNDTFTWPARMVGSVSNAQVNNTRRMGSAVVGSHNYARWWGSGGRTGGHPTFHGIFGSTHEAYVNGGQHNNVIGIDAYSLLYGSSTVQRHYGIRNRALVSSGGGTTVTNLYGLHTQLSNTGGTIASAYGIYISDVTGVGNQNYAIYAEDGSSYFGGDVGIGTTTPWRKLSVNGTVAFGGLTAAGASSDALCLTAAGEVVVNTGAQDCTVSSERFKHTIQELTLEEADSIASALAPVAFRYNDTDEPRLGLIAEEVAQVDERLIFREADGRPRGVRYGDIVAILLAAFQKQKAELALLAERVGETAVTTFDTLFAKKIVVDLGEFERVVAREDVRAGRDLRSDGRLCIGSTCITEADLQAFLAGQASTPSPTPIAATPEPTLEEATEPDEAVGPDEAELEEEDEPEEQPSPADEPAEEESAADPEAEPTEA